MKRPVFTRGYQESREKLLKNPRYTQSCFNCGYYYNAVGDKEEVCQNEDVVEYDMVVTETSVSCIKWIPPFKKSTEQQSMFKRGRSKLD